MLLDSAKCHIHNPLEKGVGQPSSNYAPLKKNIYNSQISHVEKMAHHCHRFLE